MVNAVDIISFDEAKDFLNITADTSDAKLPGFITAASLAWVNKVGPVAGAPTYDEWYDGGGSTIALRHAPVMTVAAITEAYSSTLAYTLTPQTLDGVSGGDAYGYSLDAESGQIVRRANGTTTAFANGTQNVRVTYTAGYAAVPEDIKFAVKIILREMWGTQRGGGNRSGSQPDPVAPGSLWPAMASAIANNYYVPGIA